MTVFSGNNPRGVVLQAGTDNPSTLLSGGYIGSNTGDAVYGNSSEAWTFFNYGTINAPQGGARGIQFENGGAVTNAAASVIGGNYRGIEIVGARGAISNLGTIVGADPVPNSKSSTATLLRRGGVVVNGAPAATSALILGGSYSQGAYFGNFRAAYGPSAAGTVVNYGTIASQRYTGIVMSQGGTVINSGSIVSAAGWGNYIRYGLVINNSGALISGVGYGIRSFGPGLGGLLTVTNQGTIAGTTAAVQLQEGGLVTNGVTAATGALITARINAVYVAGGAGTVANYGTIADTGPTGHGVDLRSGGNLTNAQGGMISGAYNAVRVYGSSGTVTNAGTMVAGGGGVNLNVGGTVTNARNGPAAGTIIGYDGVQIYQSSGIVVNFGTIAGTVRHGAYLKAGGTLTNESGGAITGSNTGVRITGGAGGFIANAAGGLISGYAKGIRIDGGAATIVNDGRIVNTRPGFDNAVYLTGGAETVVNGGTISGGGTGVNLFGSGNVSNLGTGLITAYRDHGVYFHGSPSTLTNSGTIAITGTATTGVGAVGFSAGGNVTNNAGALIRGNDVGIYFSNVSGSVSNSGTVTANATHSLGIDLADGGVVTNGTNGGTAGLIVANQTGVAINGAAGNVSNYGLIEAVGALAAGNFATGVILFKGGTVNNFGTIQSIGTTGTGVNLQSGGNVANASTTGLIVGYSNGIFATGAVATVTNLGTIASTGTASNGVNLEGGGLVSNAATGTISGNNEGVLINGAAGTVLNHGTISHLGSGTSGEAVYLGDGGVVVNYTGALISGARVGAPGTVGATAGYPGVVETGTAAAATVVNYGAITNPNNSNGVNLLGGGLLINKAGGLISGYHEAVYIGGRLGVPTPGALGTVMNYGTIANSSSLGAAVHLASGGTVTNFGLIASGRTGVALHNTAGMIFNFGTVVSTAPTTFNRGVAIYLQDGGLIRNESSGLIAAARGAVELGVALTGSGTTTASATLVNAGTIVGSAGISVGAYDTASNTIINSGTIIGVNGTAIAFRNNFNVLELLPGSYISGNVDGGGGTGDVLELGSSTGTGTVGTGVQFTNFAGSTEISVDPGANWVIDGVRNFSAGVTIVDAGNLTFNGDVNTYGMLLVQQGGVADDADIASGGIETVAFGGADNNATIDGGGTQLVLGTATGTAIDGGGQDIAPGGVTFNVVVDAGGVQTVLGTANGTVLNGGAQIVGGNNAARLADGLLGQPGTPEGLAVSTTVSSGGAQTVLSGGTASATTVSGGGQEAVAQGGTMVGATISGGLLDLQAGSVAAGTIDFSGFAGAGGGTLEIDGSTMPTTPIGGFVYGDKIDLTGLAFSTAISATVQNGTLNVTSAGTVVDQLTLNGIANGTQFTVSPDGAAGGTAIGLPKPKLAFMTGSYDPWNTQISPTDPGSPETAMNTAFGAGNWIKLQGFTGAALTAGYQFIYIDGGDGAAGQFDTFVSTYRSALQTFVAGGGTLFVNAARWVTAIPATDYNFNLGFGGVTLTHGYSNTGNALQPTNPVFNGPNGSAGTYWSGNFFSHDVVGGNGLHNLIQGGNGVVLAGEHYGSGYVMFGGMTSPFFDFGTPQQGDILRANILDYTEGGGTIGVPAPTNVALSPASESGVAGSNDTNVTKPVIIGDGVAGDTVTVFDGAAAVGTGTVSASGTWGVTTGVLANGVHSITATETASNGAVSPSSTALSLTINTMPPQTTGASLIVTPGAGATPIGIAAPTDEDPASALTVTIDTLPTNGTVTLADGHTAVTAGEHLSVAQLTSLDFAPNAADNGTASNLVYTVTDLAGNTAVGTATLSLRGATLYQFLFTYNDGKDYFEGTVADSGNFGYHVGETIQTSAGAYSILGNLGSTGEASGTVFVTDYSHNGPGQASTTPVDTAAGQPDSTSGLGNVSDFVLGLDGLQHPFSPSSEVSFVTNALYGFVFDYSDGREYYSGTVAAALGSAPSLPTSPIGSYSIFFEGLTASVPGSVSVDRFVAGSNSFIPQTSGGNGNADGTSGLGSEVDSIIVNGAVSFFSDMLEPTVYLATPTIVQPTPPTSDSVFASEVYDLYADVLNRVPDQNGLNTYAADLANGESISTLRAAFANSAEAQMDLNTLYNIVFSRNIDASGIATYTNLLANGSSLSAIQLIIGQSPEAQADIQTLYEQVLNRGADPAGLVNATAFLAGGGSLDAIRLIFAHSQEAAGDLSAIFQSARGRSPDAAELAGMEDQLALTGASQSSVVPGGGVAKVVPPTGSQTLTAAPGAPTEFDFSNISFTNDTISGFNPAIDALVLPNGLAGSYTQNANGSSTLISFTGDPNQSILLSGVSNNSFGSTNVRFA